METTTLSSKGQIIIPKSIRDCHHWQPGTEFIIDDTASGLILRPRAPFPTTSVEEGVGCAGYTGPAKTLEEIETALDADLCRQWR